MGRPLPKWPKGQRCPGSGRKKGTPSKASIEARQLCSLLVTDPAYQRRLSDDFRLRRVHPSIEALVWTYHLGKPTQRVEVDAHISVMARIEEERRIFAALDTRDLEQLAAESQALIDRAAALSRRSIPQDVGVDADLPEVSAKTLGYLAGSDNQGCVNYSTIQDIDPATPTSTEGSTDTEDGNAHEPSDS